MGLEFFSFAKVLLVKCSSSYCCGGKNSGFIVSGFVTNWEHLFFVLTLVTNGKAIPPLKQPTPLIPHSLS